MQLKYVMINLDLDGTKLKDYPFPKYHGWFIINDKYEQTAKYLQRAEELYLHVTINRHADTEGTIDYWIISHEVI